jgi:predicted acetyltransferase
MDRVRAGLLPLDHELFLLLQEPRRLKFNQRDGLWVRLVDAEAALNARRYKPGEPVVIDVADEFCPWNAGTWEVGPEGASRSRSAPELRLDASALGSAYLGGFTFGELARAERVEELADGALDRADTLFRTDRYPWCPEIF